MIFGIDVSQHQGTLDWGQVAASGVRFVIARAVIATRPDADFRSHVAGARAAGIPVVGAYHFLYHRSWVSPEKQADAFLAAIGDPDPLLTVLDVERDGDSKPDITDVRRFAARFRARAPDHPLIVYTGGWYWRGVIGDPVGADVGPLWASRYASHAGAAPEAIYSHVLPAWWTPRYGGWKRVSILQFTSSARVPGYGGRLDANAFPGSVDDLRRLGLPPGTAPVQPTQEEDMPRIPVADRTPKLVDPIEGRMLYDSAGKEVVKISNVGPVASPFGVSIAGVPYRAIVVLTGGQHELLFVRTADAAIGDIPPAGLVDGDAAFNAGVDAALLAGASARR